MALRCRLCVDCRDTTWTWLGNMHRLCCQTLQVELDRNRRAMNQRVNPASRRLLVKEDACDVELIRSISYLRVGNLASALPLLAPGVAS